MNKEQMTQVTEQDLYAKTGKEIIAYIKLNTGFEITISPKNKKGIVKQGMQALKDKVKQIDIDIDFEELEVNKSIDIDVNGNRFKIARQAKDQLGIKIKPFWKSLSSVRSIIEDYCELHNITLNLKN